MNTIAAFLGIASGLLACIAVALSLLWHKLDEKTEARFNYIRNTSQDANRRGEPFPNMELQYNAAREFQKRTNIVRIVGVVIFYLSVVCGAIAILIWAMWILP